MGDGLDHVEPTGDGGIKPAAEVVISDLVDILAAVGRAGQEWDLVAVPEPLDAAPAPKPDGPHQFMRGCQKRSISITSGPRSMGCYSR